MVSISRVTYSNSVFNILILLICIIITVIVIGVYILVLALNRILETISSLNYILKENHKP